MSAVGPVNDEIIQCSDNAATPRIGMGMFIEMPKYREFRGLPGGFGSEHLE